MSRTSALPPRPPSSPPPPAPAPRSPPAPYAGADGGEFEALFEDFGGGRRERALRRARDDVEVVGRLRLLGLLDEPFGETPQARAELALAPLGLARPLRLREPRQAVHGHLEGPRLLLDGRGVLHGHRGSAGLALRRLDAIGAADAAPQRRRAPRGQRDHGLRGRHLAAHVAGRRRGEAAHAHDRVAGRQQPPPVADARVPHARDLADDGRAAAAREEEPEAAVRVAPQKGLDDLAAPLLVAELRLLALGAAGLAEAHLGRPRGPREGLEQLLQHGPRRGHRLPPGRRR